ncbi:MAG: hypothetical protein ABW039_13080 [Sphingobium sp.]
MSNNPDIFQPLGGQVWLTESQTAERLALSKKWLQAQRLKGAGIPYAKFGTAVRYSLAEIQKFEAQCLRFSTSDDGSQAGEQQ